MTSHLRELRRGAFPVLTAALLWGTVGPAQALAHSSIGPAALGGWRLLLGGLMLAAVARRRLAVLRAPGTLVPLLVCAGSTALYQAAFLYSVPRAGAALATVVALGTAPPVTGLIARRVLGDRLGVVWAISTAAAVAGCILLMAPADSRADVLGLGADLVGGLCYGLYTVYAHRLSRQRPPSDAIALAALPLLLGSLPLLPWTLAAAPELSDPVTASLVIWLSLITTAVPYALFTRGMRRVGAATAGTLSLAEPLAAALLGVLVLHEHLSPAETLGSLLILGGLAAACLPAPAAVGAGPDSSALPQPPALCRSTARAARIGPAIR